MRYTGASTSLVPALEGDGKRTETVHKWIDTTTGEKYIMYDYDRAPPPAAAMSGNEIGGFVNWDEHGQGYVWGFSVPDRAIRNAKGQFVIPGNLCAASRKAGKFTVPLSTISILICPIVTIVACMSQGAMAGAAISGLCLVGLLAITSIFRPALIRFFAARTGEIEFQHAR